MLYFILAQSKQKFWEKMKKLNLWFFWNWRPAIKTTISWEYPFKRNSSIWYHLLKWVFMDGRGEGGPGRVVLILGCAEIKQPIGVRERNIQPIGAGSHTWRRVIIFNSRRVGHLVYEEQVFKYLEKSRYSYLEKSRFSYLENSRFSYLVKSRY